METAIQKAIEGGWKSKVFLHDDIERNPFRTIKIYPTIYSDPLFWQALGKQQGWERNNKVITYGVFDAEKSHSESASREPYVYYWHRFIDHIAEGKEIDLFFKELLK